MRSDMAPALAAPAPRSGAARSAWSGSRARVSAAPGNPPLVSARGRRGQRRSCRRRCRHGRSHGRCGSWRFGGRLARRTSREQPGDNEADSQARGPGSARIHAEQAVHRYLIGKPTSEVNIDCTIQRIAGEIRLRRFVEATFRHPRNLDESIAKRAAPAPRAAQCMRSAR